MLLQPITSDLPCNYNTILFAQEDWTLSDLYCLMNVWDSVLGDDQNLPLHSPVQPDLSWACFLGGGYGPSDLQRLLPTQIILQFSNC